MSIVAALDDFRRNLAKACKRKAISQRKLARESGIHYVTVNRIFNGHVEPSLSICEKLANAAGISLGKIFSRPS